MIVILQSNIVQGSPEYRQIVDFLNGKPNITTRVHREVGASQTLTEIYLIGDTLGLDKTEIESLAGVERVVRIPRNTGSSVVTVMAVALPVSNTTACDSTRAT